MQRTRQWLLYLNGNISGIFSSQRSAGPSARTEKKRCSQKLAALSTSIDFDLTFFTPLPPCDGAQ
ncbi:hypothetical protein ACIPEN_20480 [Herbaspirillum chlorophenolicum]|uniref:Uncharacterized protein n=1 Tax=Herbaspirillum chlorophenolicum TaxID=211589 RepID=A0ABW8F4J9_9BURK